MLGSAVKKDTPWMKDSFDYGSGISCLHYEIEHYYELMRPTLKERKMRCDLVNRLKTFFTNIQEHATVTVYGSYETDTFLPTSDIDLVVEVDESMGRVSYQYFKRKFYETGIADADKITILDSASVPIIKLTDKATNVNVDISFNKNNSANSAELIKKYMDMYPPLAKLICVLKQFLIERNLNEAYKGGLSSYSLTLMCISFLQLRPRSEQTVTNPKMAELLMEFLEVYGCKFNFQKVGIRITDGGKLISKNEAQCTLTNLNALCIEDPLLPSNNVARSNFGFVHVKEEFRRAFAVLSHAVNSNNSPGHSILSNIINITDEAVASRRDLQLDFSLDHFFSMSTESITSSCSTASTNSDSDME